MDNTTIAVTMNGVTHNITIPNDCINTVSINNMKTLTVRFKNCTVITTTIAPVERTSSTKTKRIIPLEDAIKVFEKGELSYGEALDSIKEKCSCGEVYAKGLLRKMMEKEMVNTRKDGKKTIYSIASKQTTVQLDKTKETQNG